MSSNLRISIVIPAYNEENHLAACLDAIAAQTLPPYEVIVVDNNSTDNTTAIASSYPFVRLLTEKRQGVVHARQAGFDAARGDIIGRIDVDTHIAADWVETLVRIFQNPDVQSVTGSVHYYDIALGKVVDAVDAVLRGWLYRRIKAGFLWGANMAIRKSLWVRVRTKVCRGRDMHEDLDLGVHIGKMGMHNTYDTRLRADVSGRRIDTNPLHFYRYLRLNARSYERHSIKESRYTYVLISLALVHYVPLRILYRGFDVHEQRFSLKRLFGVHEEGRVNPATFTD